MTGAIHAPVVPRSQNRSFNALCISRWKVHLFGCDSWSMCWRNVPECFGFPRSWNPDSSARPQSQKGCVLLKTRPKRAVESLKRHGFKTRYARPRDVSAGGPLFCNTFSRFHVPHGRDRTWTECTTHETDRHSLTG